MRIYYSVFILYKVGATDLQEKQLAAVLLVHTRHLRRISKHNLIPIISVKNTYETLVKFRIFDLSPVRIIGNIF